MGALKIGSVRIKNPFFLAPMVDVTDLPFRLICRKGGAGMAYTEMLYIDAIVHENSKTVRLLQSCKSDSPVGVQIAGNMVGQFKSVVPHVRQFDLVDINCGCPSHKITGNHAGSFLLKSPDKIADMIRVLKQDGLTVTAKIRLGFKRNNALKVASLIERAGADALAVHARLASQGNSVRADWSWIKKIKDKIGIPIIGNGDVFSGEDAATMLDIADGVMIARAAIGDPMIFSRLQGFLRSGKEKKFDFNKNLSFFIDYLDFAERYNSVDVGRIKFIGGHFFRYVRGAAQLRNEFMQLKRIDLMREFVLRTKSERYY